jgi:hypothetical protein
LRNLLYISCTADTICSSKRLSSASIRTVDDIQDSSPALSPATRLGGPNGGRKQQSDLKMCDRHLYWVTVAKELNACLSHHHLIPAFATWLQLEIAMLSSTGMKYLGACKARQEAKVFRSLVTVDPPGHTDSSGDDGFVA